MNWKNANKFARALKCVTYLVATPFLTWPLLNYFGNIQSEKIKGKSHLEILLKQEKKQLDIEDKNITASFNDTIETSYARKMNENSYEICLANNQKSFFVLKHELYHIADGHCDASYDNLRKSIEKVKLRGSFFDEPKAAIYGATGIKL